MADLAADLAEIAAQANVTRTVALPVVIIPEATAPIGAGIVHEGLDASEAFARIRAARAVQPGTLASPASEEINLPAIVVDVSHTDTRTGLSLHYGPAEIARHEIPRAYLVETLENAGFGHLAPGLRTGKAQFGKVMKSLNSQESRDERGDLLRLKSWAVTRNDASRLGMEWPETLASRYCVGHLDATPELGSMGAKVLVCSLVEISDDVFEVQFTGGTNAMRQAVSDRFTELYGTGSLNVTDLIEWAKDTLLCKFGAVRSGFKLLIVGATGDERIVTAERFWNVLQGSDVYGASPLMGRRLDCDYQVARDGASWSKFCQNLGAGMVADVKALGKEFAKAYEQAQARDRAKVATVEGSTVADQDLAARRALILERRAGTLLATLNALQSRARDAVSLVGREAATPAINACEAVRAEWANKCEGTALVLDMRR
jgi:hypothetical protein